MDEQSNDLQKFAPEHTLDYFVQARDGHKRNYIFRYGEARTCDHPEMKIVARGGNMYRCTSCNYVHQWPGAITWPLHFTVIQGAFQMLHFAKEFGWDALNEVMRRPIGQMDGTPHKPVLPEGMSFTDVLTALDEVDVTAPDGGKEQLGHLLTEMWEAPEKKLGPGEQQQGLSDGDQTTNGTEDSGKDSGMSTMPA